MSKPRPKRAGEQFARSYNPYEGQPESKKPRFDLRNPSLLVADAAEEDAVLELDEVGKGVRLTKRNAVNLDGYESDSSTENFDARAEAKAKRAREEQQRNQSRDSDEDMFADGDGDDQPGGGDDSGERKKKKRVEFLDLDDIEGQVDSSKAGGLVSADLMGDHSRFDQPDSSSDSGDDELRDRIDRYTDPELGAGGKKKHAPRLDAFNMRAENEEGRFDQHGNYVRKAADPDAVHDNWLDGLKKKDFKKAKAAHEKREEQQRQRDLEEDAILTKDLLSTLISHLEPAENTSEALQRLNKGRVKKQPKWKQNKRKDSDAVDAEDSERAAKEAWKKQAIETISGAAARLMARGEDNIYEQDREILMRQYKEKSGEDWVDAVRTASGRRSSSEAASTMWEFRWAREASGGAIHGPYDGLTMAAWKQHSYFQAGVEFRRVGESEWVGSAEFI